jgi:hypothetical protein
MGVIETGVPTKTGKNQHTPKDCGGYTEVMLENIIRTHHTPGQPSMHIFPNFRLILLGCKVGFLSCEPQSRSYLFRRIR